MIQSAATAVFPHIIIWVVSFAGLGARRAITRKKPARQNPRSTLGIRTMRFLFAATGLIAVVGLFVINPFQDTRSHATPDMLKAYKAAQKNT